MIVKNSKSIVANASEFTSGRYYLQKDLLFLAIQQTIAVSLTHRIKQMSFIQQTDTLNY